MASWGRRGKERWRWGRALSSPLRAGRALWGTRGYKSGPRNHPARAAGARPHFGNSPAWQKEIPGSLWTPSLAAGGDRLKPGKVLSNLLILLSSPGLVRRHRTHGTIRSFSRKPPAEDLHSQSLSWGMEVSTCCYLVLHFPVKPIPGVPPWKSTSQVQTQLPWSPIPSLADFLHLVGGHYQEMV